MNRSTFSYLINIVIQISQTKVNVLQDNGTPMGPMIVKESRLNKHKISGIASIRGVHKERFLAFPEKKKSLRAA